MPVVIFFEGLDLEPDNEDFETLVNQQTHLCNNNVFDILSMFL